MLTDQTFESPPMFGLEAECFIDQGPNVRSADQLNIEVFAEVKQFLSETPWTLALYANTTVPHRKVHFNLTQVGVPFMLIDVSIVKKPELCFGLCEIVDAPQLKSRLGQDDISCPRHVMNMDIDPFLTFLKDTAVRGMFYREELMQALKS